MKIDLHQHTTLSDGTDSVEELIEKNKKNNIDIMAITDHDNIDSAYIAETIAQKMHIKYITGVEFSTSYCGESVHILCYGYDVNDPVIHQLIDESISLRHKRIHFRLNKLKEEFGIELSTQMINQINNSPNPNKPMIANILKELGYGEDIGGIIKKYLYHKMPNYKLDSVKLIEKLANSTGISVYAHPLGGVGEKRVDKTIFEQRLATFYSAGLKGIECFYSLYDKDEQDYLISEAKKFNLLISGGSDYHGKNKTVQIGELSNFGVMPSVDDITITRVLL